jgi:ribosomal protein S8
MLTEIINGQRKFKESLDTTKLNFKDTLFQIMKEGGFYYLGDYQEGVIDGTVFTKDKMLVHIQTLAKMNEFFFLEKEGTYLLGVSPNKNLYNVVLYEQKANIRLAIDVATKITLQKTYDNLFNFLRASYQDSTFSLIKE